MIFLSVTGSFVAAVTYDRRQKRKVQKKWCDLVAHLALDPLPVNQMRRKLTVYLESPPGDTLGVSRQYFRDYVKPVLVAAALDYEVVEGRKEGEVRYGTAERIRHQRRKTEHMSPPSEDDGLDPEQLIEDLRQKVGITPEAGIRGDLVVGRHTWKEYIRGLHEGWLGPLDLSAADAEPSSQAQSNSQDSVDVPAGSSVDRPAESPVEKPVEGSAEQDLEADLLIEEQPAHETPQGLSDITKDESSRQEEKKRPYPPPSYLPVHAYSSSTPGTTLPDTFEPSAPIPQPHILGFLNTPIRIYRYLNQRHLADNVGRQVAAIALGTSRPYSTVSNNDSSTVSEFNSPILQSGGHSFLEQHRLLQDEESEWHKSVHKTRDDDTERLLLDEVVVDPRIGDRMRKFVIDNDALQEPSIAG